MNRTNSLLSQTRLDAEVKVGRINAEIHRWAPLGGVFQKPVTDSKNVNQFRDRFRIATNRQIITPKPTLHAHGSESVPANSAKFKICCAIAQPTQRICGDKIAGRLSGDGHQPHETTLSRRPVTGALAHDAAASMTKEINQQVKRPTVLCVCYAKGICILQGGKTFGER
jgi:hypothetical protein